MSNTTNKAKQKEQKLEKKDNINESASFSLI